MISLETFTTWINANQTQRKADDDFSDVLKKLNTDNYFITSITEDYLKAQDLLLQDIFGKANTDTIYWWLYECGPENSFFEGDNYIKPFIYDKDDNVIDDLTEIKDLYEYVTNENRN